MTASLEAPARQDNTCRAGRPAPTITRRDAERHGARRRRQRAAQGLPTSILVDAQPAREHVQQLRAAGMGYPRVAAHAGVPAITVSRLLYGQPGYPPSRRIAGETARRLLAVRLDIADAAPACPVGARRRLQALTAVGWSAAALGEALGWQPRNVSAVIHGSRGLYAATERAIRRAYDRMWDAAPPERTPGERLAVVKARRRAQRHGWAPPMAWDDDTIDDPDAQPAVDEPASTRTRVYLDEVELLRSAGVTDDEIATRLGVHVRSIDMAELRARRAS